MSEISLFRISNKVIFTKKNEKAVKLPKRQVSGRFFFSGRKRGGNGEKLPRWTRRVRRSDAARVPHRVGAHICQCLVLGAASRHHWSRVPWCFLRFFLEAPRWWWKKIHENYIPFWYLQFDSSIQYIHVCFLWGSEFKWWLQHWNFRFTMSWQSRIQVLLMNRFRKSLNKWGYGSEDQGRAVGGGRAVCLVVSGPWQCAFLGGRMPKSVLWMLWNCFVRHVQHFVHFTLLWMCVFSGKRNELDVVMDVWKNMAATAFPTILGRFFMAGTMISSLFHPFHGVCGIYTFLWRSIWCRWCVAALQNRCRATKRLQGRDVWLCLCDSVFRCSMALLCSVDLSQVQHFRSVLHSVLLRHKFSTTLFSKL